MNRFKVPFDVFLFIILLVFFSAIVEKINCQNREDSLKTNLCFNQTHVSCCLKLAHKKTAIIT